MNATTKGKIDRLLRSARNAASAKNIDQRDAARTFTVQRALELCERRDRLVSRMDAGWLWVDENPGHPQCNANEDRLIGWVKEYEAIVDALDEASLIWTAEEAHNAA